MNHRIVRAIPLFLSLSFSLALALVSGCALTSKATPVTPRYFSPEYVSAAAASPPKTSAARAALQLGQVSSASHLDERIAYRLNSAELGFYDDRRWTEPPEAYLRRALERELFEEKGLERIITGPAPSLDVELTAFEELRGNPTKVRVTLRFSLHDEQHSVLERSINVEREVPQKSGDDPAARLAETFATALHEAVVTVAEQVLVELRALPEDAP